MNNSNGSHFRSDIIQKAMLYRREKNARESLTMPSGHFCNILANHSSKILSAFEKTIEYSETLK